MLKISESKPAGRNLILKLEGRIVGPWVDEAREACERALSEGRKVKLNLAEVSFVDQDGVKFLREIASRGVTLAGGSLFVEEQLKSAANG